MSMTIQETFRQADLKNGEKYTLLFINDFAFPCVQKITLESIEERQYAQYKDAVRIVFRPYKKRNCYQKYFYNSYKRFAVLKGWFDVQTTKTVSRGGMTFSEICSGDISFIERACAEHPEAVVINYTYQEELKEVTEAVVVRMVNGRMTSEIYALKDLEKLFEVTGKTADRSEERKRRLCCRAELDNRPILKGFCGPFWGSENRLLYEDHECFEIMSA